MASDRIHLSGEEEKAKPGAGDPFWSGKGFAAVLWNPGKEASLYSAVLAGNGEHLAALSSCLRIGWAADIRHLLRWHWGLKKGSDLGIGFCRLHPHPCGCPLNRTPVRRVSVCLQARKLKSGGWARGEGLAGRQEGQRDFPYTFGGA